MSISPVIAAACAAFMAGTVVVSPANAAGSRSGYIECNPNRQVAVNSYTTGLSPAVMEYMLKTTLIPRFGGKTSCDEIGLPVSATGGVVPCGATAIWEE